jgi:hypothetical protein
LEVQLECQPERRLFDTPQGAPAAPAAPPGLLLVVDVVLDVDPAAPPGLLLVVDVVLDVDPAAPPLVVLLSLDDIADELSGGAPAAPSSSGTTVQSPREHSNPASQSV